MIHYGANSIFLKHDLFIKKLNSNKWNGTGNGVSKYLKNWGLNVNVRNMTKILEQLHFE